MPTSSYLPPCRWPQNWFFAKEAVRLIEAVGEGAEGTVWRGRWQHIDVAVKEIHDKAPGFNRLASIARVGTDAAKGIQRQRTGNENR